MIVTVESNSEYRIRTQSSLEDDVVRYVLRSLALYGDSSDPLPVSDANRQFVDLVRTRLDHLPTSDELKEMQKPSA